MVKNCALAPSLSYSASCLQFIGLNGILTESVVIIREINFIGKVAPLKSMLPPTDYRIIEFRCKINKVEVIKNIYNMTKIKQHMLFLNPPDRIFSIWILLRKVARLLLKSKDQQYKLEKECLNVYHFRGIQGGFKDGVAAGRREGINEGFLEGLKSGKEFGARIGNSFIPLLQIIQSSTSHTVEFPLIESARKLLTEIGSISLSNEEDSEKEARLSQIEAKIKALTVNFSKKVKHTPITITRINKSSKDELSF